jgi:hypothetical protein
MAHSNQLPNPGSKAECGWGWLQSRLERTELLQVSHEFDEWLEAQLDDLETKFGSLTTLESSKLSAGTLVRSSRRRG